MLHSLRQRVREERGFNLIEVLVVIIILGILLLIVVPSYLNFRDLANNSAARANLRAAIPAVELYNADNSKGYSGMTLAKLRGYDRGVKNITITPSPNTSRTSYCVYSTVGAKSWYKRGPGGDITTTACSGP